MTVSVILPTFNEINGVEKVLKEIPKNGIDEVLVVDGRSTDGTVDLVRKLGYPLFFQQKKGFGSAISEAIELAQGDVLVFMTADNSQNPADIPKLLDKIDEGYDIAMASRYLPGAGSDDDTLLHYIGNRLLTFLCNKVHKANFSDCLYFFFAAKRKVFDTVKITSPGFESCMELPIKIHKAGFKIAEIPSFEKKRMSGHQKVNTFLDGYRILKAIFKF